MTKKYRVWNDGSPQCAYITASSPKQAAIDFKERPRSRRTFFDEKLRYPIHVMLWSKPDELHPLGKRTKEAEKFNHLSYHSFGNDIYIKYGRKYYKKDLI